MEYKILKLKIIRSCTVSAAFCYLIVLVTRSIPSGNIDSFTTTLPIVLGLTISHLVYILFNNVTLMHIFEDRISLYLRFDKSSNEIMYFNQVDAAKYYGDGSWIFFSNGFEVAKVVIQAFKDSDISDIDNIIIEKLRESGAKIHIPFFATRKAKKLKANA